jgi:hypothetical protein
MEQAERKPELIDSLAAVVTTAGLEAAHLTVGLGTAERYAWAGDDNIRRSMQGRTFDVHWHV